MFTEMGLKNAKLIRQMAKIKSITPSHANINFLRRLSKLFIAVHNDRRGAESRLFSALSLGFPDRDLMRFNKLIGIANKSTCNMLATGIGHYVDGDGADWDMLAMIFSDTADHLNICRLMVDGRSAARISKELLALDTGSRDRMADAVYVWIHSELVDA